MLMEILREFSEEGVVPAYTTHFIFSDYEEIGHGAYGFPEDTSEFVAVDIGTVGGKHTSCEHKVTIVAKDSRTPYDVALRRKLERLCEEQNIPYATDVHFRYGSDASVAVLQGLDVRFACFGLGIDATHHYERAHIDGIQANIDLLRAYLLSE